MKKISYAGAFLAGLSLFAASSTVWAQEEEGFFSQLWDDVTFSTFVRAEAAVRTTDYQNPNNQGTNFFQDRTVARQAFVPPSLQPVTGGGFLTGFEPGQGNTTPGNDWSVPAPGFSDTLRRGDFVPTDDPDFNYTIIRAESELQVPLTDDLKFIARARGVFDPTFYDSFNARDLDNTQMGIAQGRPELYAGEPNYFEALGRNGKKIHPLEIVGDDFMIDFPALVLDYRKGKFSARFGNQQIAWGQSIFFRTLDVVNGLDFRRHLLLDRALEEFSDKRVPMISLRLGYQFGNIVADSFVGKFQPRIFGNPNTPYNVIPAQFTVRDNYHTGGYDDELNFGLRLKGDYGTWSWQAIAVSRMNPAGTFRWDESGLVRPLQGTLGGIVNTAYNAKLPDSNPTCQGGLYDPSRCRRYANSAELLAEAPFAPEPGGVYSANEWFKYAADVRLAGVPGLNTAVSEFPAAQDLYATTVDSYQEAFNELNTFFVAAGGSLRGFVQREYHREDVFGLGGSYVTTSDNNFLNQIIVNLEVQYTPERTFTDVGLSRNFIEEDEYIVSLVADKWHRFFQEFPGTFMVAQFQHRSESDLVGRHLSGYGGTEQLSAPGVDSANYFVFGFMQPWPNRFYVLEFAMLYDLNGGILAQPNLQINPGDGMTIDIMYNYINGTLHGKRTDNVISSLDWAEEATIRFTYQF